jgi:cell division protein FtsN
MVKIFLKVFLSITLLNLTACSSEPQKAKIRIVDLQGNFKPVLTKIPDFNAQVLDGQDSSSRPVNKASQEQQSTTIIPENPLSYANNNSKQVAQNKQIAQTLEAPTLNSQNKIPNDNLKNQEKNNMMFAGRQDEKIVSEYDLANSRDEESNNFDNKINNNKQSKPKEIFAQKKRAKILSEDIVSSKAGSKKYYVQVGSYGAKEIADEELIMMQKFHKGKIELAETSDRKMYRVLLGPFTNKIQARKMVNKIVNSGHEAILVKGN